MKREAGGGRIGGKFDRETSDRKCDGVKLDRDKSAESSLRGEFERGTLNKREKVDRA